jgi:hypothetical protein
MLDWGRAQGRAETSALWTPSLWKASPCHDTLKEQLALHTKTLPIGPRSHCSVCCRISDPPALLLSSTRAVLPQTPTPQTCTISARWARKTSQAGATDIHDLSWAMPSGLHRPPQSLVACIPKACQASYPQTSRISTLLAHALQACQAHQAHPPKAH